jgi:inosose dehydratase
MSMRVGNAPVSWGRVRGRPANPPYADVLDQIAAAGYEGTELGPYGYLPTEPESLARELRARKLGLGSSFVPLPLEDATRRGRSVEQALRVARLLATQRVEELILADDEDERRQKIAGRVPADGSASWSDAQWREACATVEAVARALRQELGMRVVLHHHAGTFVETPQEVERFLAGTDAGERRPAARHRPLRLRRRRPGRAGEAPRYAGAIRAPEGRACRRAAARARR